MEAPGLEDTIRLLSQSLVSLLSDTVRYTPAAVHRMSVFWAVECRIHMMYSDLEVLCAGHAVVMVFDGVP